MMNNEYMNRLQQALHDDQDKYRTVIVHGIPTNYKIDRQGNLFSTFIKYQDPKPVKRTYKYQDRDDSPRCQIHVGKGSDRRNVFAYLDRLVATTFVPNPGNDKYLIHLDYNLQNVQADNLKWVDRATWNRYEFERLTKDQDKDDVRLVKGYPFYVHRNGEFNSISRPTLKIRKIPMNFGNRVTLRKDGKRKLCRVDHLVAQAFLPNPYHYQYVKHLNFDFHDDRASNLAWCSRDDMILYKYFYSSDMFRGFRILKLDGHYTNYAVNKDNVVYYLKRCAPIHCHQKSTPHHILYNLSINKKIRTLSLDKILNNVVSVPEPDKNHND